MSHSSDSIRSLSIFDGIKLLLVLLSESFVFARFALSFAVVAVVVGVKILLESFTVLLFLFSLFVLLFVAVAVVLDGIKMFLVFLQY